MNQKEKAASEKKEAVKPLTENIGWMDNLAEFISQNLANHDTREES